MGIDLLALFLKGFVAFVVTFAWAYILYPLARKIRKAWYFFLLGTFIVTTFSLFLKTRFDPVPTLSTELIPHFMGVFLGMTLMTAFFWRQHIELDALPEDTSYLLKYGIDTKLRLRFLFQIAILMEEEAATYYTKLAAKVNSPAVRDLCLELVKEEELHQRTLQIYFHRWLPVFMDRPTLQGMVERFKQKEAFFEAPSMNLSERELLGLGIRQEQRFVEFYQGLERAFPRTWKRMKVKFLVTEEQQHIEKLEKALATMSPAVS